MESWENKGFDYFKHFTNGIESSRKSFGEKVIKYGDERSIAYAKQQIEDLKKSEKTDAR